MNGWIEDLFKLADNGQAAVLVTVIEARGSAPRGSGARMIVTGDGFQGSVGGGQLEYQCIAAAGEILDSHAHARLQKFVLGASLDQCCGGAVEVLFEPVIDGVPDWLETLHGIDLQRHAAVLATDLSDVPRKSLILASSALDSGTLPEAVVQTARVCLPVE